MTRTSAQNKALTASEDKSLTPDYDEPDTAPDTAPEAASEPDTKAAAPAAPAGPTVTVIWSQFSHGHIPGEEVKVDAETARAMIHAGYATAPAAPQAAKK